MDLTERPTDRPPNEIIGNWGHGSIQRARHGKREPVSQPLRVSGTQCAAATEPDALSMMGTAEDSGLGSVE